MQLIGMACMAFRLQKSILTAIAQITANVLQAERHKINSPPSYYFLFPCQKTWLFFKPWYTKCGSTWACVSLFFSDKEIVSRVCCSLVLSGCKKPRCASGYLGWVEMVRIYGEDTKRRKEVQETMSAARQPGLMESWNIIEDTTVADFVIPWKVNTQCFLIQWVCIPMT